MNDNPRTYPIRSTLIAAAFTLAASAVAAETPIIPYPTSDTIMGKASETRQIQTQPLEIENIDYSETQTSENQTENINNSENIQKSITNITNNQPFMLGAIVGDIIGSTRERYNVKRKDFNLFPPKSHPTDDTVMSLAVAKWLTEDATHSREELVKYMQQIGKRYPNAGYGGRFFNWLIDRNPQPYNSWGNGSAMRVSPVGLYATTMDEAMQLAEISAEVTHNHPEGIKGAQAIAAAVMLARQGKSKSEIKDYITENFHYNLDRKLDDIRASYQFDVSCQGSVPEAIIAYLESTDFEDAIRNAISIGGDSDTIAAMAGSIAAIEYGIPENLVQECLSRMTTDQKEILEKFEQMLQKREAQLKAEKAEEEAQKEGKGE